MGFLHAFPPTIRIGCNILLIHLDEFYKIHRPEHVTAGLYLGRITAPLLALIKIRIHGSQSRQMSSCRPSDDADALRIDLVLIRMGTQKANGRLHIDDLGRHMCLGAAAVIHGCQHIPGISQKLHLRHHQVFVAAAVSAARHPEDCRLRSLIVCFIIMSGGKPHLAVAVLQHDGHL